jgi:hypothetical protein
MKKIIAVAIASVFVTPVYAADITVGGEVEYAVANGTSANTTSLGEQEIQVRASEELANGMTVSAYLDVGDSANTGLTIGSSFGTLKLGDSDGDTAIVSMDDKADVAPKGGAGGNATYTNGTTSGALTSTVTFEPNLGVEGLRVIAGMGYGDAKEDEVSDFAVQYSAAGFAISYGEAEVETLDVTTKNTSVSYTYGPLYIGFDAVDGKDSIDGGEMEAVGVTYNYGSGKIGIETNERNYNSTSRALLTSGTTAKETVVFATYQMGSVNTYVAASSADSADATTEADTTYVGVEYKF